MLPSLHRFSVPVKSIPSDLAFRYLYILPLKHRAFHPYCIMKCTVIAEGCHQETCFAGFSLEGHFPT